MVDFKITGGAQLPVADAPEGTAATETVAPSDGADTPADAVTRIAEELASRSIDGGQALERMLAEVIDSPMLEGASPEMVADLEESLRALIETDPYLRSLALDLGIKLD